jgi:hypothetical protein
MICKKHPKVSMKVLLNFQLATSIRSIFFVLYRSRFVLADKPSSQLDLPMKKTGREREKAKEKKTN